LQANGKKNRKLPVSIGVIHHQLRTAEYIIKKLETDPLHVHALCDPVGFGKTFTALFIASRFVKKNRKAKILIVLPNDRLYTQWVTETELFNFNYMNKPIHFDLKTFHSISLKERRIIKTKKYNLVIVDEAHKLKGSKETRKDRYINKCPKDFDLGKADKFSKHLWGRADAVLFLTATPFPKDIAEFTEWFRRGIRIVHGDRKHSCDNYLKELGELHELLELYTEQFSSLHNISDRDFSTSNEMKEFLITHDAVKNRLPRYITRTRANCLREEFELPKRIDSDQECKILDEKIQLLFIAQEIALHKALRNPYEQRRPHFVTSYINLCSSFKAYRSGNKTEILSIPVPVKEREHPKVNQTIEIALDRVRNGQKALIFTERILTKSILVKMINDLWTKERLSKERSLRKFFKNVNLWGKTPSKKFGVQHGQRTNKTDWRWLLFRPNAWDLCSLYGLNNAIAKRAISDCKTKLETFIRSPTEYPDYLPYRFQNINRINKKLDIRLAWWISIKTLLEKIRELDTTKTHKKIRGLKRCIEDGFDDNAGISDLIGRKISNNLSFPNDFIEWFINPDAAIWEPFADEFEKYFQRDPIIGFEYILRVIDSLSSVMAKDTFLVNIAPNFRRKTKKMDALLEIHKETRHYLYDKNSEINNTGTMSWKKRIKDFINFFYERHLRQIISGETDYEKIEEFRDDANKLLNGIGEADILKIAYAVGGRIEKSKQGGIENEDEEDKGRSRLSHTIEGFNTPFNPMILVGTPRDSESINLQDFCETVIHHDIPFSPLRYEQRIGRVQRIHKEGGREYESVKSISEWLDNTYDMRIYSLLNSRKKLVDFLLDPLLTESENRVVLETRNRDNMENILMILQKELSQREIKLDVPQDTIIEIDKFPLLKLIARTIK